MMNLTSRALITAGCMSVALSCGTAMAQNALGDGQVLDRNLSTLGTRNTATPQTDFRARNLLVTGDVAGGRGFRSTVGYRAAGDFDGALGSDLVFRFEADSAFSAMPVINYRTSMGALSLGQDFGVSAYRRSSTMTGLGDLGEVSALRPSLDQQVRLDRLIAIPSLITGSFGEDQSATISMVADREGRRYRATASTLRGIQFTPEESDFEALGLSLYDQARIAEDFLAGRDVGGPGRSFRDSIQQLPDAAQRADDRRRQDMVTPPAFEQYREFIEALDARYRAEQPESESPDVRHQRDLARDWLRQSEELMRQRGDGLTDDDPASPGGLPPSMLPPTPGMPDRDLPDRPGLTDPDRPGDRRPLTDPADLTDPDQQDLDVTAPGAIADTPVMDRVLVLPEDFDVNALKHGRQVDRLIVDTSTRFGEIMSEGEQRLRSGDYFTAERRFLRALRYQPDHPFATAGLAHAQLGAGVHLSAAVTLRQLLVQYPEMIDVRYSGDLRIPRHRAEQVINSIRIRAAEERAGANSGLLLAWLGRQYDEKAWMTEGLDLMQSITPTDAMVYLLRSIWLDEPFALPSFDHAGDDAPSVDPADK